MHIDKSARIETTLTLDAIKAPTEMTGAIGPSGCQPVTSLSSDRLIHAQPHVPNRLHLHLPSIANADPASLLASPTLGRRRRRRRQGRLGPAHSLRLEDLRVREHVQVEPAPVRAQVPNEALGRHFIAARGGGRGGGAGAGFCGGAGRVAETLGGHRPPWEAAVRAPCRDAQSLVLPGPGTAHALRSGSPRFATVRHGTARYVMREIDRMSYRQEKARARRGRLNELDQA